ncbi:MAG: hypothetical protein OCD76_19345 [Reichenbachiella sp.]
MTQTIKLAIFASLTSLALSGCLESKSHSPFQPNAAETIPGESSPTSNKRNDGSTQTIVAPLKKLSNPSQATTQSTKKRRKNVKAPASTTKPMANFKMGNLYLHNNIWGSASLNCNTYSKIFVREDATIGWKFNRQSCGGMGSKPDYPRVKIGISPFNKTEGKKPRKSTTTLLPLQVKDILSASATIKNFKIQLLKDAFWNTNFKMWLSKHNPTQTAQPEPEIEFTTFWGWMPGRWSCDQDAQKLQAGTDSYTLCHQIDDWNGLNSWNYYQFRIGDGLDWSSRHTFNGTLDIKAALNWLVTNAGISPDLWVTRFEVGSEIDDHTSGKATIKNITFEVNGKKRSVKVRK